jgi:hypothetical protein
MAATDPGPRDQLMTRSLERALESLDGDLREEGALDPAEAPERLARHAMEELRRGLSPEELANPQAERVNNLLHGFGEESDGDVALPARVLYVARRRPG